MAAAPRAAPLTTSALVLVHRCFFEKFLKIVHVFVYEKVILEEVEIRDSNEVAHLFLSVWLSNRCKHQKIV